ncbi:MAG: WD40/YVTN/BNR-like repeat-containing protein [Gemmatimonadaceae bacterium]
MSYTSDRLSDCTSRYERGMAEPARGITQGRVRAGLVALLLSLAAIAVVTQGVAAQAVSPNYIADLRWRSIGPYRSGNVSAVTGIPDDPTTYYIGTPEAGVWKTSDGGTVWKPIFDDAHVASVGAIAVSPSNPEVVYVGTGDPSGWSFTPGNGVYKTTDAGKTWRNIGLEKTQYINSVIVDPKNPNIVLIGAIGAPQSGGPSNTARGVYRSTDGGVTWKNVLYKDAYTGVKDMAYDVADPRVMYAAFQRGSLGVSPADLAGLSPLGTGIYKSTDEGATWKLLNGKGLPEGIPSFELAVASGTHGKRVYAEAQGAGRDARGVYHSEDGGDSWSLGTKEIGSAGGRIYADPKNPDVVYLMGTSMYRSVDGAHKFTSYKGAPGGDDNRDLWIDPSNPRRMLMGADQGPSISVDNGETWTPWYNLPNGQFYNVTTDGDFPYRVCGAQQDSGTACVLSQSDYGRIRENDWYAVGGFERGAIVPDPLDSRWIYTQGWYHVLRRYDRITGQVAVLYTPTPEDRFGGLPPMAFSPQNPRLLYMAAQYVMASSDSARHWHHISPDLTAGAAAPDTSQSAPQFRHYDPFIQTMSISVVDNGEIWVGTNNGVIQLTRDGGKSWTNVTPPGLPARAVVNIIDASHSNDAVAYAAVNAPGDSHPYIYRTADFGKSWTKIVTGLPDNGLVRVVRVDPIAPNLLYAGTVTGAWVSFDRGDHWQSLQLSLPNTVVSDITVHRNDLAISTYGRGLWVLDDVTPLRQAHAAVASNSAAYLYAPQATYRVRWDNDQDTPRPPEVPAGENAPEGAIIYYHLKTHTSGPISLSIRDAHGNLVRQYTNVAPPPALMPNVPTYWFAPPAGLPTTAGLHRVLWDLRYPDPQTLPYGYSGDMLTYTEYTLTWHAVKGNTPRVQPPGPLAIPGKYEVQLSVDGHTYTQAFTIETDPRLVVPQAHLVAQLQSEQRMTAGMAVSYAGFNQIDRMRKVLAADAASAVGKPMATSITAAARTLDQQLSTLANGPEGGFGMANRDLARHLEDADFGDMLPTPSNLEATEANCRQIDVALADFHRIQTTTVPQLNAMLLQAQLTPLPTELPLAGPGCVGALNHPARSVQ